MSSDKKIVLVNLDESSVSFAPELPSGLIVIRSASEAKALVAKQDSRCSLTYLATICDDKSLQAKMPHFIIGDKVRIRDKDLVVLEESPKENVFIWRNERSAWNNHTLMQKMLTALSDAFSDRPDLQLVLILDVAPCHIHKSVFLKARQLGVWLFFVPSGLTCLLQPLDTHAFFSFKSWLRKQYAALRGRSGDGLVARSDWLQVLQIAKEAFFDQKSWTKAFTDTGARLPIARLTKSLRKYATAEDATTATAAALSQQGLSPVWPKRLRMEFAAEALFSPCNSTASSSSFPTVRSTARSLQFPPVSIALSSRTNKRACRQYPSREPLREDAFETVSPLNARNLDESDRHCSKT